MSGTRKSISRAFQLSHVSPSPISFYFITLFVASQFFSYATSSPLPHASYYNRPTSTKLYGSTKIFRMRVVATACAAVSMSSSFVVLYWFCRMEKRFRHRLIMLLVYGDLIKATSLFLLALVSLTRGTLRTESPVCQAGGFFLQFGTETADYAVLVIAIHSALQVFRPSRQIRSDGLYPVRYQVYALSLGIPSVMSSLAFINPHWGYMSQGPFCSLPLRPLWYRLALNWIPRYLIAIIILSLAIAIYVHVGFEFRAMSNSLQHSGRPVSTTTPIVPARDVEDGTVSIPETAEYQAASPQQGSSMGSFNNPSRRISIVTSTNSHNDHPPTSGIIANGGEKGNAKVPSSGTLNNNASSQGTYTSSHIQRQRARSQMRIRRQLRLMLIYPIVYIFMWLIPFANHCTNYSDDLAAHPIYWLGLASTICYTLMGAVDCLIFSLREHPWRHITSSDSSFLGSFIWWRSFRPDDGTVAGQPRPTDTLHRAVTDASPNTPHVAAQPRWRDSMIKMSRNMSARMSAGSGSDQARVQAKMARARLEFEREDMRVANAELAMARAEEAATAKREESSVEPGSEAEERHDTSGSGAYEGKNGGRDDHRETVERVDSTGTRTP